MEEHFEQVVAVGVDSFYSNLDGFSKMSCTYSQGYFDFCILLKPTLVQIALPHFRIL